MLWIRIRSDPHHLAGSGHNTGLYCAVKSRNFKFSKPLKNTVYKFFDSLSAYIAYFIVQNVQDCTSDFQQLPAPTPPFILSHFTAMACNFINFWLSLLLAFGRWRSETKNMNKALYRDLFKDNNAEHIMPVKLDRVL